MLKPLRANMRMSPMLPKKHDSIIQEAEEALHGVQMSMLLDPELKAEVPPFFSKECRHMLFACGSGYFATVLYGYDAGIYICALEILRG
jgi:hypothetical protein